MYDTLMQMGRWFGYRPGFEDLCRVHLSQDSINWYSHIANASEELRQQIKRMRRDGLSPKQFGLYVQSHPDSLLITAANKMRSGEEIVVNQNFTGKLKESTLVPIDPKINARNEELIGEFWRNGFGNQISATKKGWFVPDVKIDVIETFLTRFQVHRNYAPEKSSVISYLNAIAGKFPHGDVLLISSGKDGDAGEFRLGPQERVVETVKGDGWQLNGYRVASRGDEALGLSDNQIEEARVYASTDTRSKSKKPSDYHYRIFRNKPLLMLHVLAPAGSEVVTGRIPAFGVSFPDGLFGVQIEVVANRVWLEQMYGSFEDSPDDEDDYDE